MNIQEGKGLEFESEGRGGIMTSRYWVVVQKKEVRFASQTHLPAQRFEFHLLIFIDFR